jgi:4-amino-4-deoxy-L-arabinose transferase-like glycosyltransferase
VHFLFYFITGIYLVISALFFVETNNIFKCEKRNLLAHYLKWFTYQGKSTLLILFLALSVFGYFEINNIASYAGVDEPLWTLDRIPNFWKNISEMDWKNTSISDKPGITVVLLSGFGLLDNPVSYNKQLKTFRPQKDIYTINKDFRLPLVLFCLLSLLFFYIFIQVLLGKNSALLSVIFISTSPMLIGMSRIINPDAILWVFVSLTILAYLIFLKKETRFWLYIAGILLGLSILTKYVANILYVFFFALIFLEYLFISKDTNFSISIYLKKAFINFLSLIFISLITFYFLFPETWVNLNKLFTGTILSQAFISIAPIFIGIILFLAFDIILLKSKITARIFNFLSQKKSYLINFLVVLFTIFVLFVFANTYFSMHWVEFQDILSSPKTSYRFYSILAIFSTNFYPLVFTSLPIVMAGLFFALLYFFKKHRTVNIKVKVIFYFLFFILLYYLGTTFNGVVSTIRYQVILYPLLAIISAIGIDQIIKKLPHLKYTFFITTILLLIIGALALAKTKPFYLGYASRLLPNRYIVDVKDMGDGSYQIARYLNSLPDAKKLFIWTDKKGVCTFFVGKCDSFYDTLSFKENPPIDYFVISSGRKNKILNETKNKTSLPYDFEKIYDSQGYQFAIFIGDRPKNYIKVIKTATDLKNK